MGFPLLPIIVISLILVGQLSAWAQRPMRGSDRMKDPPKPKVEPTPESTGLIDAVAPAPETDQPTASQDDKPEVKRAAAATETDQSGTTIEWFGHAFVYVTTPTGVRIAIDPYDADSVQYTFPLRLPADVVLVSNERSDHAAAERLYGNPQVFRSYTAVGSNRANGLIIKGVEVPREPRKDFDVDKCTSFLFEIDGIKFAHLGNLGDRLSLNERSALGQVDVIFLPVGNKTLSIKDIERVIKDLGAKVVIPVKYLTEKASDQGLRPLSEYLEKTKHDVKELETSKLNITNNNLPSETTIYVLKTP